MLLERILPCCLLLGEYSRALGGVFAGPDMAVEWQGWPGIPWALGPQTAAGLR